MLSTRCQHLAYRVTRMWACQYAPSPNRSTLVGGLLSAWDIAVIYKTREVCNLTVKCLEDWVVGCRKEDVRTASRSGKWVKCRREANVLGRCRRALHV